ncbi:MAG: hypothetical protein WCS52_04745 [bacterium]
MSDDIFDTALDIQNDIPDEGQVNMEQSSYGASMDFVPSQFGPGGGIFEGGNRIATIAPNLAIPGGYHMQSFGSSRDVNMGDVLDSFDFKINDVHMPWSAHDSPDATAGIVGSPDTDAYYWQPQTTPFTCAVQAQRGIIEEYTGNDVSEAALVYEATSNGWLTDRGMAPSDVGDLLQLHGIPCHSEMGASIQDLMAELAQGHKVIVGVDSDELWHDASPLKDFFHQSADHAIWVTGVDATDPNHPQVIINDSGDTTGGAGKAYDLEQFKDAWQDSGFFYVATDNAPSDMSFAAGHGFDEATGVFPAISSYFGGVYDDFRSHLQERLADSTQVGPGETTSLLTDAAVRAFIENLPKSRMASLNESATDTLFRII